MFERVRVWIRQPGWQWLALIMGAVLLLISNGRWIFPLATWIAPCFILRFLRVQKNGVGVAALVVVVAAVLGWQGMIPMPGPALYFLTASGIGLISFLPYAADWLLTRRFSGWIGTLIFPTAVVTLEYASSLLSPFGTWGALAYTQMGFLPLIQLASLTGLWGVSFLIAWFGSIANWAWRENFQWRIVGRGILAYAVIFVAVIVFGGVRMAALGANGKTIRVATITTPHEITKRLEALGYNDFEAGLAIMSEATPILMNQTRQAVRDGAQVVFWSEGAAAFRQTEEANFMSAAQELARQEQIYLGVSIETFPSVFPGNPLENKIIWIDPAGNVTATYYKANPVPGEPIVRGAGPIPFWDGLGLRMGTAICYDMDFPAYVQSAGRDQIGLMLVPGSDWIEIDPLHSRMAAMRAVENGFSLVRATNRGLSLAVDGLGRTYATKDYFSSTDELMLAELPAGPLPTLYAWIGDAFAWVCAAALILFLGAAVLHQSTPASISAAAKSL
jgi:apolipoprotein N-acyltransferase